MKIPFFVCLLIVLSFGNVSPLSANSQSYPDWLAGLRTEALQSGISLSTLDAALVGVVPLPRVLELDGKQPENRIGFTEYLARTVTAERVARGRRLLAENRDVLDAVAARYNVPARYIVALWGIETDFGRNTGGFGVIPALVTLAYDGRRANFFRGELLKALQILEEGHIDVANMRGSWAGAMGQSQFMPSSFLKMAVDLDGDGHKNIWTSRPDVFASIANYLHTTGWNGELLWGREVRLPVGFNPVLADWKSQKPLSEWTALGVKRMDGTFLPQMDVKAAIVIPRGSNGRAWLVYDNYRVLMDWNRSTYFATSVGILADRIGY